MLTALKKALLNKFTMHETDRLLAKVKIEVNESFVDDPSFLAEVTSAFAEMLNSMHQAYLENDLGQDLFFEMVKNMEITYQF